MTHKKRDTRAAETNDDAPTHFTCPTPPPPPSLPVRGPPSRRPGRDRCRRRRTRSRCRLPSSCPRGPCRSPAPCRWRPWPVEFKRSRVSIVYVEVYVLRFYRSCIINNLSVIFSFALFNPVIFFRRKLYTGDSRCTSPVTVPNSTGTFPFLWCVQSGSVRLRMIKKSVARYIVCIYFLLPTSFFLPSNILRGGSRMRIHPCPPAKQSTPHACSSPWARYDHTRPPPRRLTYIPLYNVSGLLVSRHRTRRSLTSLQFRYAVRIISFALLCSRRGKQMAKYAEAISVHEKSPMLGRCKRARDQLHPATSGLPRHKALICWWDRIQNFLTRLTFQRLLGFRDTKL